MIQEFFGISYVIKAFYQLLLFFLFMCTMILYILISNLLCLAIFFYQFCLIYLFRPECYKKKSFICIFCFDGLAWYQRSLKSKTVICIYSITERHKISFIGIFVTFYIYWCQYIFFSHVVLYLLPRTVGRSLPLQVMIFVLVLINGIWYSYELKNSSPKPQ